MADARNRQTPLPFSNDDAERIRRAIATPGSEIVCPQCDDELTSGLPAAAGGGTIEIIWELRCPSCSRTLLVTKFPNRPPPHEM